MTLLADELDRLAVLKRKAERVGQYKKARDACFKEQQDTCLDQMEAQKTKSHRGEDGTLFTRVEDRVKGQVEDRKKYIRYCLEQDEGVQEFLEFIKEDALNSIRQFDDVEVVEHRCATLEAAFYDLLVGGLELVAVKEKQDRCNAQARNHIDDGAPLPPGLTFRPDPYIQQRRS